MRTVVAMSGGVDSSVAAALLANDASAGEVLGVTLQLMPRLDSNFGCCGSPREIDDARRVCEAIGIPHYVVNLSELFEKTVIAPFVKEYLEARTPNPCVECNRHVKFDQLMRLAEAWGADKVATGHYARLEEADGVVRMFRAADRAKDQTYFLHPLTQPQLQKTLFPLGGMTKPQVREAARRLGLATAEKPESQEICFVGGGDYRRLLEGRSDEAPTLRPGPVVDVDGRLLGSHKGVARYTVGQREGLPAVGKRMYVREAIPETNTLVVGSDEEAKLDGCSVERCTWTVRAPSGSFRALVQLRHRHTPVPAVLEADGSVVSVRFDAPQRGVAPGQSAVFYLEDEVLGGGIIK
jgi:tRNA-specific 2-thiouridylase